MKEVESACQALFTGRINVAKAAAYCGLELKDMKKEFKHYVKNTSQEDWELDITPCWPYA